GIGGKVVGREQVLAGRKIAVSLAIDFGRAHAVHGLTIDPKLPGVVFGFAFRVLLFRSFLLLSPEPESEVETAYKTFVLAGRIARVQIPPGVAGGECVHGDSEIEAEFHGTPLIVIADLIGAGFIRGVGASAPGCSRGLRVGCASRRRGYG